MPARKERKIRVKVAPGFKEAYHAALAKHPGIKEKIEIFNRCKKKIPPDPLPSGMKDHELGDKLKGIRECHLSGDVLLLYVLGNDELHFLVICEHDDLRGGGREAGLAKKIKGFLS